MSCVRCGEVSLERAAIARSPADEPGPSSRTGHLRREARRRARSESPIAKAFCRTAPSDRLSLRPMILAGVRCRANVLSSRTSRDDHSRRATRLFAAIFSISNRLLIALYCALWPNSDHQARRKQQSQNREGLVIACSDTLFTCSNRQDAPTCARTSLSVSRGLYYRR